MLKKHFEKRFRLICWLLVALFVLPDTCAEEVTTQQVATAVGRWLGSRRGTTGQRRGHRIRTCRTASGDALFHVANLDGGGFVVMSSDDELSPVIACSSSGSLDLDARNPIVQLLTNDMSNRLSCVRKHRASKRRSHGMWRGLLDAPVDGGGSSQPSRCLAAAPLGATSTSGASQIDDVRIDPLVRTKWNQSDPFNYYMPDYPAGCGPVAFAQIMRYWEQPTEYVTPFTEECSIEGVSTYLTAKGGYYDWANMPNGGANMTVKEKEAVGRLLFDCAVCGNADFRRDGTSTWFGGWMVALQQHFGYAGSDYFGAFSLPIADLSGAHVNNLLASLDGGMPCLGAIHPLRGDSHFVVIDGYGFNGTAGDNLYLHMNFGWSGSCDLWYNIFDQAVVASGVSYVRFETVCNINPNEAGCVISGRVVLEGGSGVSGVSVSLKRTTGESRRTTTKAQGVYSFIVPPGTYEISATYNDQTVKRTVTVVTKFMSDGLIPRHQNSWGNNLTFKPVSAYQLFFDRTGGEVVVTDCLMAGEPKVVIPGDVTRIGDGAFDECKKYKFSVTIPSSVKKIGNSAFRDCTRLTSVSFADGLTTIGDRAFYGCTGLKSVSIPGSVTSFGYEAFRGCSGLTSVTLGEGLKDLGSYGFADCTGLTEVTLPKSMERVSSTAFSGCGGITVTLKDGLTDIPSQMFGYCSWLVSVKIPASVKSIGQLAFEYSGLTSVTLPRNVTIMGSAFSRCTALATVTIPAGVRYALGSYSFIGCTGLSSVTFEEGVQSVDRSMFYGCTGLTSVTIPASVDSIGSGAFEGCVNLRAVTFLGDVCKIDIGNSAFYKTPFQGGRPYAVIEGDGEVIVCGGCPDACVGELVLPDGVTRIAGRAFYSCAELTAVTMPASVNRIGSRAFSYCSKLSHVTFLGDELEIDMEECVFDRTQFRYFVRKRDGDEIVLTGYTGPELVGDVVIPDGVTQIGGGAFPFPLGCEVTSLTIPASVRSIGEEAFYDFRELQSVSLPTGLVNIGTLAFGSCYNLSFVTIPGSVERLGDGAFCDCVALQSVELHPGLKSIGEAAFYDCDLSSISIPDSVEFIGYWAFAFSGLGNGVVIADGWVLTSGEECPKAVIIPEGTKGIAGGAFDCGVVVDTITIPSSVRFIGPYPFLDDQQLKTIHVEEGDVERIRALLEAADCDVSNATFVEYPAAFPVLPETAAAAEVAEALRGAADPALAEHVVDAEAYGRYRAWARKVGMSAARSSPNAWVSFAMDSARPLERAPTDGDLRVDAFEPSSENGSFDFTVSVEGVKIGPEALADNLKMVFGLEGASSLDPKAFGASNVEIEFGRPVDGKLTFTAGPSNKSAQSFFMKVKVK